MKHLFDFIYNFCLKYFHSKKDSARHDVRKSSQKVHVIFVRY
jgi:hypothetical protein